MQFSSMTCVYVCAFADCKHEYSVGHNISIKGSIYPLIVARTFSD